MIQRVFGDKLAGIDRGILCFLGFKDANKFRKIQFNDRNATDLRSTGKRAKLFQCLIRKRL